MFKFQTFLLSVVNTRQVVVTMATLNNFNFSQPRCAESLPRVPPYNVNIHNQSVYSQHFGGVPSTQAPIAPRTVEFPEVSRRPRPNVQGRSETLGRSSTAGTIFGVYAMSSEAFPSGHAAANRSSTLGGQGRSSADRWSAAAKRSSLGHALLLDKGGNTLNDFYNSIDTKPSQFIVGRQTSARPHHVCYSLQVSSALIRFHFTPNYGRTNICKLVLPMA